MKIIRDTTSYALWFVECSEGCVNASGPPIVGYFDTEDDARLYARNHAGRHEESRSRTPDLHEQNEYSADVDDAAVEYTPTTELIRSTYATDYYMTQVRGNASVEQRAAAFDRWLASFARDVLDGKWKP